MTLLDSPNPAGGRSAGADLPVNLTRFIGRGHELDDLARLIDATRMVTLTGAGGSGKTRLAREVADRLAAGFDQIGWVDLAPVTHSDTIERQVAAALGVPERPDMPTRELMVDAVGRRRVLLVLDNCEHLVDGCADLAQGLLRACSRITVLATSREALGVTGETAWLVPPLAPDDAGELFEERARAAVPSFQITPENAATVAEICHRLDGIPLAIELAAARVRVLSPEQIARRLDDAFHLLTGRNRTGLPRHRTLRATMDWSHGLLEEMERVLLRRLSVFSGSFTLDAAEAVCASEPLGRDEILDRLTTLVDKSLVVVRPDRGAARYRLLETVRQYGRERLEEAGERADLEQRFAGHFLALIEEAEPSLVGGSNDPDLLERTVAEIDNLRAASLWAVADASRAETALRFVGASFWICYALGLFREMREATDRALGLGCDCAPHLLGRALVASGLTALAQGEYERASRDFARGLPLVREAGDDQATAVALAKHGAARMLEGDLDGAVVLLDEAVAFTSAWAEDEVAIVFARFWRSWVAFHRGEHDHAHKLMSISADVGRRYALPSTLGHSLSTLAHIEMAQGRVKEARRSAAEALEIEVGIGDGWGVALALDVLAAVAVHEGAYELAARIMAGTEAHRKRIAVALLGPLPGERKALLDRLEQALGRARLDELYRQGISMSVDQTVRLARAVVDVTQGGDGSTGPVVTAGGSRDDSAPGRWLEVRALGGLEVLVSGRPVDAAAWGSARPRELLVYLLLHPGGCTKEQVGLVFWPDASTAQLRNNFHVTLHRLRKALGGSEWVSLIGERYRIDPEELVFDATDFERDLDDARRALKRQADDAIERMEGVLERYRGDFMEGESAGDWHLEHRDHLRRAYLAALADLGRRHALSGAHERAADAYRRILARDDLDETALRGLVEALVEAGNRSQALLVYHRFTDRLRAELGSGPDNKTVRLVEGLLGVAGGRA